MTDLTHQQALTEYLSEYISDNKRNRIEEVLNLRTRHITVVLEDIFKPHNASAVLRTCECFGVQDIHIVEERNTYDVNRYVTRGSAKWISLHKYDHPNQPNIEACFQQLKAQGYQIVATSPRGKKTIHDIDVNKKTAIVFGTEEDGISEYVQDNADELIQIPMYGFTESFNISVAAAIILDTFVTEMRKENVNWKLSDAEKETLKLEWYNSCVKHSEALTKVFNQQLEHHKTLEDK